MQTHPKETMWSGREEKAGPLPQPHPESGETEEHKVAPVNRQLPSCACSGRGFGAAHVGEVSSPSQRGSSWEPGLLQGYIPTENGN